MQKRVAVAAFHIVDFFQRAIGIGQIGVVLGVLVDPLACYDFNSFQCMSLLGFGVNRAKEMADIGLGRAEHGQSVSRWNPWRRVSRPGHFGLPLRADAQRIKETPMNATRIAGIVLIVAGVAGLLLGGFSYNQ